MQLQRLLLKQDRSWDLQASQIATYARSYGTRAVKIDGADEALLLCGRFAKKICNGNNESFERVAPYGYSEESRCLAAAKVLLTAYDDLHSGNGGFFGVILDSELAGPIKQGVCKAWEKKYPFEGEVIEGPKRARKVVQHATSIQRPHSHDAGLSLYVPRPAGTSQSRNDTPQQTGSDSHDSLPGLSDEDASQHLLQLSNSPAGTGSESAEQSTAPATAATQHSTPQLGQLPPKRGVKRDRKHRD